MYNNILKKFFIIISAVILISIFCLGAVLLLISSQYFVSNKKSMLLEEFNIVQTETKSTIKSSVVNINRLKTFYANTSSEINGDIFLTNEKGQILVASNEDFCDSDNFIKKDVISQITNTPTYYYSDFNNFYGKDTHIVTSMISFGQNRYYLFVSSPDSDQIVFVSDIMKIFIISVIIVLAIVFAITYAATLNMVKPIANVFEAIHCYSNGDFSKRIELDENNELSELANNLNEMAVSLSKLDTMKNSFIANVSHELKTPMTSITGFIDGILDGTIPESEHKKYLKIVSAESKRLTRMVYSMLNMAKIESGEMKLNKSEFFIGNITLKCLLAFEQKIEDKHIEIKGLDNDNIMVYADIDLIHQVVYNLIENAIKFVNDNGYIEFSNYTENNKIYFCIKNSGEGLSESELPLIFDKFYKTDKSRSLDKSGVGLGLYITSSIIKLHNGNIMVKSIKGEYTEFIFSIPINNTNKGQK